MTPKLTIELVPSTTWEDNVRSAISDAEWDTLKKQVYRKAGYCCEICGGKGDRWPVECHEIWEFDEELKLQTLLGFIALCPSCHSVKHIGYASILGKYAQTLNHLMMVNGWSKREAEKYVHTAFKLWDERSKIKWKVDISELGNLREVTTFSLSDLLRNAATGLKNETI